MSNHDAQYEGDVVTQDEIRIKEPKMYKVLLHNDDYTTMDFVVMILETVFHKSPSEATQIMLNVHHKGVGICGLYTFDIAQTKVTTVIAIARQHEYPLQCSYEEA
jgi:ATP-dependent Clp protease adaptor protein ClpS